MSSGNPDSSDTRAAAASRGLINPHHRSLSSISGSIMDVRSRNTLAAANSGTGANNSWNIRSDHHRVELEKTKLVVEYPRRSLSRGSSGRRLLFPASYFSQASSFFLVVLAASLVFLPLLLPPLPPPPFPLLLLPIGILVVLVVLAFMPSTSARDMSHSYV